MNSTPSQQQGASGRANTRPCGFFDVNRVSFYPSARVAATLIARRFSGLADTPKTKAKTNS
jgi:hypothetical protein